MLSSIQLKLILKKLDAEGVSDPLGFIYSKSDEELLAYINSDVTPALQLIIEENAKEIKEMVITLPATNNKSMLLIEDTAAGKEYWKAIVGDRVTVVSPDNFNAKLRGNGAILKLVERLPDGIPLIVLPDYIDYYQNAETSLLWQRLQYFCYKKHFILCCGYIGFEWVFVKLNILKEAYYQSNPVKYPDYLTLVDCCNKIWNIADYIKEIKTLGDSLSKSAKPTLENICSSVAAAIHKDTLFHIDKNYIGHALYTPGVFNAVVELSIIKDILRRVENASNLFIQA